MAQGGCRAEAPLGRPAAAGVQPVHRHAEPGTCAPRAPRPPAVLMSLCPLVALSPRSWESCEGRRARAGTEREPSGKGNEASWGVFPAGETGLRPAQGVHEAGLAGTDAIHSGAESRFLEQPPGFGRGFRRTARSCGGKRPSPARVRELRGQAQRCRPSCASLGTSLLGFKAKLPWPSGRAGRWLPRRARG